MPFNVSEEDVFIIHGYAHTGDFPLFIRVDETGKINWVKPRSTASEFTRGEAEGFINDSRDRGIKVFAIRIL